MNFKNRGYENTAEYMSKKVELLHTAVFNFFVVSGHVSKELATKQLGLVGGNWRAVIFRGRGGAGKIWQLSELAIIGFEFD
jgi:hypothetical protein